MTETDKPNQAPDQPTDTGPGPDSAPSTPDAGPRIAPDQIRDVRRLQLSTTDRKIGGVCAGIARYFDIDPTVVRVAMVVLALFGGAGFWLYLSVWLLAPDESTGRAALHLSPELRKTLLIVAAVITAATVLGAGWGPMGTFGSRPAGFLVPLLIVGAVIAFAVNRTSRPIPQVPPGQQHPGQQHMGIESPAPVTASAPLLVPYSPPATPRKRGLLLIWPTLAVIAIGWGLLRLWSLMGHGVPAGTYPAFALVAIAGGLAIGAFRGRPGGLILSGFVASTMLVMTTIAGATGGFSGWRDPQSVNLTPQTATEAPATLNVDAGEITLDLSQVRTPQALEGRTISLSGGAASIKVIVPAGVSTTVNATTRGVGEINIAGQVSSGVRPAPVTRDLGPATEGPVLTINATVQVGEIIIEEAS